MSDVVPPHNFKNLTTITFRFSYLENYQAPYCPQLELQIFVLVKSRFLFQSHIQFQIYFLYAVSCQSKLKYLRLPLYPF